MGGHDGPTAAKPPVGPAASSTLHPSQSGWSEQASQPGGPRRHRTTLYHLPGDQWHLDQCEAQHHILLLQPHVMIHVDKDEDKMSLMSTSCLFVFQVHDIFHPFIQTSDDEITFITVNESKTGFCHLYKITSLLQRGSYNWAKGYTHSEGKTIKNTS